MRIPRILPVFEAMFGGARVRVVLTGMGQRHALKAAKGSFGYKPDICISTGLASSLRMIIVGRYFGRAPGQRSGETRRCRHRELLSTALDCRARQIERLATSRTLVTRAARSDSWGSQAEAVEMESYTILAEAALRCARCGDSSN